MKLKVNTFTMKNVKLLLCVPSQNYLQSYVIASMQNKNFERKSCE